MSLFNQPILVTGGAGFIGSALIAELNRRGFENIIISDILGSDEKWKNLPALRYVHYLEADQLLDRLDSELASVKCVFHLGACSATTESDCSYLIRNNYEFTRKLAEWCLKGDRRFVYASSAATYGDGGSGMVDGVSRLNLYRPLNMYGYSKHMFDLHAHRMGYLDSIVGVKYFNVFGPNEQHKGQMRSVVQKAYEQIKATGKVKLFKSERPDYEDGCQMRDFFYVKDAVDATLHLAQNPDAKGLYNLGSGIASTWIDLVTPIFEELGISSAIEFVDLPSELIGKYQYYTCADTTRLLESGWQGVSFSLKQAVIDYVGNYLRTGKYLGDETLAK
jgi:ADP-L-glycero-D-manno-heptose 6-epimerase